MDRIVLVEQAAILFDHAGNTLRFGLPQDFVVPDLREGEHKSGSKKQKADHLTTCSECNAVMEVGQRVCPACGIERPTRSADVHYIDGSLREYGKESASVRVTETDKLSWYLGLKWYAERKGYRSGWAFFKYQEKFAEKPPYPWKHLKGEPAPPEIKRWITSRAIAYAKARRGEAA